MTPDPVENAQARIREARQRLYATLNEVQERLHPSSLVQDAVENAAQGVASAARKGAEAVRKRPFAIAAFAGTIGLVMARGWIGEIVRSHRLKGHETPAAPESLKPKARPSRAKKGTGT